MKAYIPILCGVALLASLSLTPARRASAADDQGAQLQALVEKVAPAIVTVKLVTKTQMRFGGQSQDQESRMEVQGVVVDKDGLVMISNIPLSPSHLMSVLGSAAGGGGDMPNIKVIPTDIKVIFEQEDKEYPAFLAATDTKLDLAFLKIEGLGDRKLTAVDFASAAVPALGEEIVSVSRLKKGFDYAPYFETARISGVIAKPRRAWPVDGRVSEFGLPVFTLTGDTLGVLSTVESGVKDEGSAGDGGFGLFMRLLSGGGGGLIRPFVLPGDLIAGVIGQAKQQAATKAAERAKAKAAAPSPAPVKPKDNKEKPATKAP